MAYAIPDEFICIDFTVEQNKVLDDRDDYVQEFMDDLDSDDINYEDVTEEE